MVLHHPIIKARKAGVKIVGGEKEILETDFPILAKGDLTVIAEDSLDISVIDTSDLSLNQYLSMMSEQEASATYIDDVDIQSIENGTAYPKATSSVLHASPSPFRDFDVSRRRPPPPENSQISRKVAELQQMEAHLQRWSKMLEEKEQELAHKEKRLGLWETQLREMQKLSAPSNQPASRRNSYHQPNSTNESSGVESLETDLDSTVSAYPGDSILEPTAVLMQPSKIQNPFTRHHLERRVRFQRSYECDDRTRTETAKKLFAEQRLHWLEMKKKKHQSAQLPPMLPTKENGKLETDYIFMEEKSIPISATTRRICNPVHPSRYQTGSPVNKENKSLQPTCPPLPPRSTSVKFGDSKVLSNELRAKLKSHNLPGLR